MVYEKRVGYLDTPREEIDQPRLELKQPPKDVAKQDGWSNHRDYWIIFQSKRRDSTNKQKVVTQKIPNKNSIS